MESCRKLRRETLIYFVLSNAHFQGGVWLPYKVLPLISDSSIVAAQVDILD